MFNLASCQGLSYGEQVLPVQIASGKEGDTECHVGSELNLLIPKQTFTFLSCSPVSPPAPPSPVGSPPACSLPPMGSRTPPSLSASWPSTPVTMASSWSSTPQTLQLQQSRYSVCSSLTSFFLPRQQLCACHQDPGDQPTT